MCKLGCFQTCEGNLRVVAGRLNQDKGIVELLGAFSALEVPDRNVELVIVGPMGREGVERKEVRAS